MVRVIAVGITTLSLPPNIREFGYEAHAVLEEGRMEYAIGSKEYTSIYRVKVSDDRRETMDSISKKLGGPKTYDVCIISADEVIGSSFPLGLRKCGGRCRSYIVMVDKDSVANAHLQAAVLKELSYVAPLEGTKVVVVDKTSYMLRRKLIALMLEYISSVGIEGIPYFATFAMKRVMVASRIIEWLRRAEASLKAADVYYDKMTLDGKNCVDMLRNKIREFREFIEKGSSVTYVVRTVPDVIKAIRKISSNVKESLEPLFPSGNVLDGIYLAVNPALLMKYREAISNILPEDTNTLETKVLSEEEVAFISPAIVDPAEHTFILKHVLSSPLRNIVTEYWKKATEALHPENKEGIEWRYVPIFGFRKEHIAELEIILKEIADDVRKYVLSNPPEDIEGKALYVKKILNLADLVKDLDVDNASEKLRVTTIVEDTDVRLDLRTILNLKDVIKEVKDNESKVIESLANLRMELMNAEVGEISKLIWKLMPKRVISRIMTLEKLITTLEPWAHKPAEA